MNKLNWILGNKPEENGTYLIATLLVEKGFTPFVSIEAGFYSESEEWYTIRGGMVEHGEAKIIAYAENPTFNSLDKFMEFLGGNTNE